jgi:hypothetical protein
MASLEKQNPHSLSKPNVPGPDDRGSMGSNVITIRERWQKALGDAVANDSKKILSVKHDSKEYIMADIRILSIKELPKNHVALEFFFDGETRDIEERLLEFFGSIQNTIQEGIREYFRRKLRNSLSDGTVSLYKKLKYPETDVALIGAEPKEAFRDAGCMLNFIAVRVSMSEECSEAIGGIAFPEYFSMLSGNASDNSPIPLWLLAMAVMAVIMSVATVYAWSHIFIYGNRY